MEFLTVVSFFLVLLLVEHCSSFFRRRKLPPGPKGLPILGNLLDIGPNPHESLAELSKKHGPLMTIRQGSVTTIVASSPEMARLILQTHDVDFSGRIVGDAISEASHHTHSVLWLDTGEQWRLIRRILTTFLMNTSKLDSLCELRRGVMEQMVRHVKNISNTGDEQGVEIGKVAFTTAMNNISNTCFSTNLDEYSSGDSEGFRDVVGTIMKFAMKFNIADYFPLLKAFDPQRLRPMAKAAYKRLQRLCDNFIEEIRLQHIKNNLPRNGDLLDSLIDFSQENESEFTLKHIQVLIMEIFLAGTDTSSNTTEWAMTELILNPDKMQKLHNEISESVRTTGTIEESEMLKLPYLQAVIKETMRLHLAVPLLVTHKTETDVHLNGYEIPKNTQVLVNAWAIARDPNHWEKPTSFEPERFLNLQLLEILIIGKSLHFTFLPFGAGRRMCAGIPFAQRVVSMMIASLVYHFEWKLPHGMKPQEVDMKDTFGLTLRKTVPLVSVPVPLV